MLRTLTAAALLMGLLLPMGHLKVSSFAGRIELDNQALSGATNNDGSYFLPVFARFSLTDPVSRLSYPAFLPDFTCIPRGGDSSRLCDRSVSWASFSDFQITAVNFDELGSLLQLDFVSPNSLTPENGRISMFVIDPSDPSQQRIPIGTITLATVTSRLISLSEFGVMPDHVTPDFYFGFSGFFGFSQQGRSSLGGSLTILSTLPVNLNETPVALCQNVVVSAGSDCTANASIDGGSFDPNGDVLVLGQSPAGPYPLGNTQVVLTVTDPQGASSQCSSTVTVVDDQPPVISAASVSPSVLAPLNHKLLDVIVNYNITDNCDPSPSCTLSVSSNEPTNEAGDGTSIQDWVVVDSHHVRLRAERGGSGIGRVYTLTIACADATGNSTNGIATVTVPHDQR